ncbi:MAG: GreA/GreB family elongation factor [Candidatus Peribacteria bacterium]|nr:MAG: GreA/GreB family elongation factor [Candidatus Peribacteria bacterium]
MRDLLEARMNEIEKLLDNVEIIKKSKSSAINFGSVVSFAFVETPKDVQTVEIVGTGEVSMDGEMPHISFQSPIGTAIRGKKKGDVVRVRMINGDRKELTIVDVK